MDRIWAATDYAVIDLETTHLLPSYARPCEIGGVTVRRGSLNNGDVYHTLINPKRTISRDSIAIHGITREAVKDAPCFEDQDGRFRLFLQNKILVIHSGTGYDITVLRRRMSGYSFAKVLDTCTFARKLDPEAPNHKLSTLIERYQLSEYIQRRIEGRDIVPHRALYDAYAAAYLFMYLIKRRMRNGVTLREVMEKSQYRS